MGSPTLVSDPGDAALITLRATHEDSLLYPFHGRGKGGIGTLLATGARAGTARLPRSLTVLRPKSSSTLFTQSTNSMDSTVSYKTWEQGVPHPYDFVTCTRRSRPHDVPPASKWAAISFYENKPMDIKRHLDIMNAMEQAHVQSKLEERERERFRHGTWAEQQRSIFRRQRAEQATKYATAGVPVRAAHLMDSWVPSTADLDSMSMDSKLSPSVAGSLADPYKVSSAKHERGSSSAMRTRARPATSMPGFGGSRRIPLPKPSYMCQPEKRLEMEREEAYQRIVDEHEARRRATSARAEHIVVEREVGALDDFENHMRALSRKAQRMRLGLPMEQEDLRI